MTTPSGYEHLPEELNVPFECTQCGALSTLFQAPGLDDLCDCEAPFRIYVSDAGKYADFLAMFIDTVEMPGQPEEG